MTFDKWQQLYDHYQNHYDFTLSNIRYCDIKNESANDAEEWLP